jgi:hypothetical protein
MWKLNMSINHVNLVQLRIKEVNRNNVEIKYVHKSYYQFGSIKKGHNQGIAQSEDLLALKSREREKRTNKSLYFQTAAPRHVPVTAVAASIAETPTILHSAWLPPASLHNA